jgi:hypothetical protein
MVGSFNVALTGKEQFIGWPVLPQGAGAYYNQFGKYIGEGPTTGQGRTFGEFLPGKTNNLLSGEILAVSVNWHAGNSEGGNKEIYVVNYGGSSGFSEKLIGTTNSSYASMDWSEPIGKGIPIISGDYIGIYVKDPSQRSNSQAPPLLIQGTIYYSLTPM